MKLSSVGIGLIEGFEELRLVGYPDQRGIPTAGWGHTGRDVAIGQTYTLAQAQLWIGQDTAAACYGVDVTVKVPLNQNEYDALVSFTFNVGTGSEAHSTLLTDLNLGNRVAAADQFLVWDHINGVVSLGLTRRRTAERALFLKPVNA